MAAQDSQDHDTLAIAEKVDALCDRFEEAWRRGERPNLDAWLPADGPLRRAALAELVRVELEHRRQAGETPAVDLDATCDASPAVNGSAAACTGS
ncbi:MAG TPA: hypothetical protein VMS17_21870 [Gemmataceae bacterium]|nr:hypothetical protein [Gemmataceae bacterium]